MSLALLLVCGVFFRAESLSLNHPNPALASGDKASVKRYWRTSASAEVEEEVPHLLMHVSQRRAQVEHATSTEELKMQDGSQFISEVSSRLTSLFDPFGSGNRAVKIVSIETRTNRTGSAWKKADKWGKADQDLSAFDITPENSYLFNDFNGKGIPGTIGWHGYKTKILHMRNWLSKQNPDDLVIYVDPDAVWGGCSESQFIQEFQKIRDASGMDMVTGAELGCVAVDDPRRGTKCPGFQRAVPVKEIYPSRPAWANELYPTDQERWVKTDFVDPECNSDGRRGMCSNPAEMKFLNSGFVTGYARDLLELYSFAEQLYADGKVYGKYSNDMNTFHQYFYDSLDPREDIGHYPKAKLTLDYGNQLVVNMHNLHINKPGQSEHITEGVYPKDDAVSPFTLESDGKIWNKATKAYACFIHGNGNGHDRAFPALEATVAQKRQIRKPETPMAAMHA